MSIVKKPIIEEKWYEALKNEFESAYFADIKTFLIEEKRQHIVYPPSALIFNAFNLTPFDKVKVVILGQDPYHQPFQAHGLCFSVLPPTAIPPSLVNIYKEIESDLGHKSVTSGDLTHWANQGVLLLNSTLTVRAHAAASHAGRGWEEFTDAVIRAVAQRDNIVYMLWGSYAQKKAAFVNSNKNLILKSVHPSPLSAYRGFFGCKHFSQANKYLADNGKNPIEW